MKRLTSKLVIGLLALLAFTGKANATAPSFTGLVNGTGGVSFGSISGSKVNITSVGGLLVPITTYLDQFSFSTDSTAASLNTVLSAPGLLFGPSTGSTHVGSGSGAPKPITNNNVTSITESLYNGTTLVGSYTINGITTAGLSNSFILAPSANYTLQVSANGSGIFGYNLNASIAAVPEPTEGALMLSGIVLLGFISSRRKSNA